MRTLVTFTIAALVAVGMVFTVSVPASAGSTYSCAKSGYQCLTQFGYDGHSHYGYPVNSVGGNCTNYVAFRLGQAYGASRAALWQGLGDAGSWASTAAGRSGVVVNNTPSVGAVAQWSAGNHVAYVDAVNGDGSITISESSWFLTSSGHDSYVRTIAPGSPNTKTSFYNDGWPTSFIHFGGAVSSTPPSVTPKPSTLPPNTYPTSGAARVRAGTSTSTAILSTTAPHQQVTLDCYALGEMVSGSAIWDHVPALGGYISDSLIITGSAGAVVPLCSSGSGQDFAPLSGPAYIFPLSTSYNPVSGVQDNGTAITSTTSSVHVDCWVLGNFVTAQGTGGSFSDKIWYHVPSVPGWVPDAQVKTSINNSSDRPSFAQCGLGVIQGPFVAIGSTTFRDSASLGATALATVGTGTKFTGIDCTLTSDSATNPQTGQTNTLWDHIAGYGYVPDVFVLTGLDSAVAPTCATTTATNAASAGSTPPTVTGTAAVGQTLSVSALSASSASALHSASQVLKTAAASDWVAGATFEYQWYSNGTPIAGAGASTLKLTSDLLGTAITVSVVGGKAGYDQGSATSGATTTVSVPSFADVPVSDSFHDQIIWLAEQGVTTGYSDGLFHPERSVTRQAMAAFMYRFAGSPDFTPPVSSPFSDVATSDQFYTEICWLAAQGITTGYPDGTFRPGSSITRAAMAAFMYRYAGSPSFTNPGSPSFSDVPATYAFFHEIEWMKSTGVTTGYPDGTFKPSNVVTRGAMAAFMDRYDGWLNTPS